MSILGNSLKLKRTAGVTTRYTVAGGGTPYTAQVKFTYSALTEVKDGLTATFAYTVAAATIAAMTAVGTYLQESPYSQVLSITENWYQTTPGTIYTDGQERRTIRFYGTVDNGNGTYTLNWRVKVLISNKLTYIAFELPAGTNRTGPTSPFTSPTL